MSKLNTILIAAILVGPILATGVGALNNFGPNDRQEDSIHAALGAQAPFGPWVTKREETTFYMHTTASDGSPSTHEGTNLQAAGNGHPPNGGTDTGELLYLDTQRPRQSAGTGNSNSEVVRFRDNDATVATFNTLGYHPPNGAPTLLGDWQNMSVHRVSATVYAPIKPNTVNQHIWLDVHVQDAVTGVRIDFPDVGTGCGANPTTRPLAMVRLEPPAVSTAAGPVPFSGSAVIDMLDGYKIPARHQLSFDLRVPDTVCGAVPDAPMTVFLDRSQHPSSITVMADSARLSWWTQDRQGQITDTFPAGIKDQTEDTRIRFKLAIANMFGNEDCTDAGAPIPSRDNTRSDYCQWDNIDQRVFQLRFRNLNTGQLFPIDLGRGLVGGDPGQDNRTAECCNNDFHLIKYTNLDTSGYGGVGFFEYEIVYNETFPNGPYAIEFRDSDPINLHWEDRQIVHIGGAGFVLEPASLELIADNGVYENGQLVELRHVVGPQQRTDFRLSVRNTGTTTDTIGLSIPVPGQGWTATAHPTLVSIPAGQSQDVRVTVTPPSTALVGDWKAVNVVASSLLDDDTQSVRLNTTLTSQVVRDVLLLSPETLIEVNPLLPVRFPATVVNNGSMEDTFVVTTSGAPPGWTVQVDPPIFSAYAKSAQDFVVTVTAPAEVTGQVSFPLIMRATRNADAAVFDELIIPVNVIHRDNFDVVPYLPRSASDVVQRDIRDVGDSFHICFSGDPTGDYCAIMGEEYREDDVRFDDAFLYRLRLDNKGSREDTYRLTASWVPDESNIVTGDVDAHPCGSVPKDGVPDGWRYRILPTAGVTDPKITSIPGGPQVGTDADSGARDGFSGDMHVADITLGAAKSMEFYIEMKWVDQSCTPEEDLVDGGAVFGSGADDSVAARSNEPSPAAGLRLTTRSTLDDTKVNVKYLVADISAGRDVVINEDGTHPAAVNSVDLEPQLGQTLSQRFENNSVSTFRMRAINTGNEFDELLISIGEELPGWKHRIEDWTFLPVTATTAGGSSHPQACAHTNLPNGSPDLRTLRCPHVGAFDEVWFNVTAIPPVGVQVGQRDLVKVQVDSKGKAGVTGIFDTVRLESIVTGPYLFEAEELNQILFVSPENVAAFPFSIHNIGLESDTYELKILDVSATDEAAWNATLSSGVLVGVPAGKTHHGFLGVVAPAGIQPGQEFRFEVQVKSVTGGKQVDTLQFIARGHETTDLKLESTPVTLLQGQTGEFRIRALLPDASNQRATFKIANATLPDGWELVCQTISGQRMPAKCADPLFNDPTEDIRRFEAGTPWVAEGRFFMKVPVGELSTSRVALRVAVNTTTETQYHDVELNLATLYGVKLDTVPVPAAQGGNVGVVAPGQSFTHKVQVTNTGLSTATVRLSNTAVPSGWSLVMDASSVPLLPGMSREFGITMTAPTSAPSGQDAVVRIFATPLEDATKQAQLELITSIGRYHVTVNGTDAIRYVAPQEPARFQVVVGNNGNVADTINVTLTVPAEYRGVARFDMDPKTCDSPPIRSAESTISCRLTALEPSAQRVINANLTFLGQPLPGGTKVPVTVTARSMLAPLPDPNDPGQCPNGPPCPTASTPLATDIVQVEMLRFKGLDVDGDGLLEFAVDRDRDAPNGFEQFRENQAGAGITTTRPDLARFLTDEARKAKTVRVTAEDGSQRDAFVYRIDGDDDGFEDHFLDVDADGLPDRYWDPDLGRVAIIETTKDVTLDGVPELFIDFDGDGQLDKFFDLTLGRFGKLFPTHVNPEKDSFVDYIVDAGDGKPGNTKAFNGKPDDGEPILMGGPGGIGGVFLKRDVDGDGLLDEVYQTTDRSVCKSGMYFVPAGGNRETDRYCITLEDRNGDGIPDWVFDANGDGKADSWYDPATGKSHLLDPRSDFVQGLQKYWYIGAIFGLVLVLFVVLVAVTRR